MTSFVFVSFRQTPMSHTCCSCLVTFDEMLQLCNLVPCNKIAVMYYATVPDVLRSAELMSDVMFDLCMHACIGWVRKG